MCEDEAGDREGGEDELATLQDKACEGGNDEACDERVGKDFVQATCKEIFFLGAFAVWKHAFYMSYLWLCLQVNGFWREAKKARKSSRVRCAERHDIDTGAANPPNFVFVQ